MSRAATSGSNIAGEMATAIGCLRWLPVNIEERTELFVAFAQKNRLGSNLIERQRREYIWGDALGFEWDVWRRFQDKSQHDCRVSTAFAVQSEILLAFCHRQAAEARTLRPREYGIVAEASSLRSAGGCLHRQRSINHLVPPSAQ